MRFAVSVPSWAIVALFAAVVMLAVATYRRARLSAGRRLVLTLLRASALGLLVFCLLRPVVPVGGGGGGGLVAVLVDASRSMALDDAEGLTRIERAGVVAGRTLPQSLGSRWRTETLLFGEELRPAGDVALAATAHRSELGGAVRSAVERYRTEGLAGVIVVSDGGDTSGEDLGRIGAEAGVPIVTVGVGRSDIVDREISSVATGRSSLDASLVELSVTVGARGTDGPLDLRLLQNGRVVERRSLVQAADGAPVRTVFTVAPDRTAPTVYSVELSAAAGELTTGNNQMSVLVPPPGRRRRVLTLEGSPGFEHTFLKRAWAEDPSLEVDSAVRKGRNEQGVDTFFVQAAGGRGAALATGFPATREALYAYDTVMLGNVDAHRLTLEQMEWLRSFVSERGGGLLVLGARTLTGRGLIGSPLDEVLPLKPGDGGGVVRASAIRGDAGPRLRPTSEGTTHPLMRIAATDAESLQQWAALPPLAGRVSLGAPRPGAAVLAVADTGAGDPAPIVAVQRFGAGRVLLFAGEASWRWRMMMPASDQSFERFWRQAARWLAADAPDAVSVTVPEATVPGDTVDVGILVRDGEFLPAPDARLEIQVDLPTGEARTIVPTLVDPANGRFIARFAAVSPGVHRVRVEATRDDRTLGQRDLQWLAGGVDRELLDPRLNESALRRLAESSGGRYLEADQAAEAVGSLVARNAPESQTEWRDLWHTGWIFVLIIAICGSEWALRRQWGLR